jgi:superfamily I DNA and/or RNA helicase
MSESTDTRLAVLEQIAENHDRRISDIEDFHREVVDRLDQKIQLDSNNQIVLERTLTRAVTAIDSLNDTVKSVGKNADEASKLAARHEIIGATILRIGGALVVVISGAWAAFTYFTK